MTNAIPVHFVLRHPQAAQAFAKLISNDQRFTPVLEPETPAGLVFFEVGQSDEDLARITAFATSENVTEVFVIAPESTPDLILNTIRSGASEFLPLPLKADELQAALNRFISRQHAADKVKESLALSLSQNQKPVKELQTPGRIIHFIGGKHGTGVTTLATNLAVEAARIESTRPAALIDLRQPQGEVPLFLDIDYRYTWAEATHNSSRLDEAFLQSLMSRHASGLDILAAPDRSEDTGAAAPQAITTTLQIMRSMYSTIVVDGSPYLDEITLAAMQEADYLVMVAELSLPCLANTRRLIETLDSIDTSLADKAQLLVNRHTAKAGVEMAEAEELLERKVSWIVADDYEAALSAINQGAPLHEVAPRSELTKNIARMASALASVNAPHTSKKSGLFGRLFGKKSAQDNTVAMQQLQSVEG